MARSKTEWQPTERDKEILRVLEQLPLTPSLLLKWSERFELPFPNVDVVNRRLRVLRETARLVHRWPLAIASEGRSEHYVKLTPKGFRLLREEQTLQAPNPRAFAPVGEAHHRHTLGISKLIVHLGVHAHRLGMPFTFLGENRHRITVDTTSLRSDGFIGVGEAPAKRGFRIEVDNSTESILSTDDADSIEQKIRLTEEYESQFEGNDLRRSITVFVTLRSSQRMRNILAAAATLSRNPRRRNFYGIYLPDCLACAEPLTHPCFFDHNHTPVSLLPPSVVPQASIAVRQMVTTPVLC